MRVRALESRTPDATLVRVDAVPVRRDDGVGDDVGSDHSKAGLLLRDRFWAGAEAGFTRPANPAIEAR